MHEILNFFANLHEWFWVTLVATLSVALLIIGAGIMFIWIALMAVTVAFVFIARTTFTWQHEILLVATALLGIFLIWRLYKKRRQIFGISTFKPIEGTYIGRTFTLQVPIIDGHGQVQINNSLWSIQGPDLPAGTKIRIVGLEGTILTVVPAEN